MLAYVEDCHYTEIEYEVPDSYDAVLSVAVSKLPVHMQYLTDMINRFSHVHQNGKAYRRSTDEVFPPVYQFHLGMELEVLHHVCMFWIDPW
jgi:hypothetical protein